MGVFDDIIAYASSLKPTGGGPSSSAAMFFQSLPKKGTAPPPGPAPIVTSAYDDAARRITDTTAGSRFTRTPIHIMSTPGRGRSEIDGQTVGQYSKDPSNMSIYLGDNPTWRDMQNAIHHEDVHATLAPIDSNYGSTTMNSDLMYAHPPSGSTYPTGPFDLLGDFHGSGRRGDPLREIPAYMSAYKENQMEWVSPAMASEWLQRYVTSLPPATGRQIQRISDSNKASQDVR